MIPGIFTQSANRDQQHWHWRAHTHDKCYICFSTAALPTLICQPW